MYRVFSGAIAALTLLFGSPVLAQSPDTDEAPLPEFIEVFAEMRDGIKLAANLFLPEGQGPFPVVVARSPYIKDNAFGAMGSTRFTDAGFAYLIQDVRGKGHSEGAYIAFNDDIQDGYDTVEWIASQPWCDGNVGITGGSALGIAANAAAIANPPHLKAAYIVIAREGGFWNTFMGGVYKEQDSGSWQRGQGNAAQVAPTKARPVWDIFWERRDILTNREHIRIPIYNIGGWYDIFAKGSVNNFSALQNNGSKAAKGNQKLLMSPTGHGSLSGDLEYPDAGSAGFGDSDEIRWFEYWLKGIDNGIMDEPPVKFFMMAAAQKGDYSGKNRFIEAANWPLASRRVSYYLNGDKSLSTSSPEVAQGKTSYVFDPENTVATVGGANLTMDRGPMDQRVIPERSDYLRFETETLESGVVIAGQVLVELWAATDGLDTDFMAKLVDVYPDGYGALILDAPIRTRYLHGRKPDDIGMMIPNVPEKLTIDLWSTANTFEAGHRIALHIASSNDPRFEVNPNTGEAPGSKNLPPRKAQNTIYHDRDHQSALVLPVIYPEN